jgi:hypothetical protein
VTVFDLSSTLTVLFFIVLTIKRKYWGWLAGLALVAVPLNIARVLFNALNSGKPLTIGRLISAYFDGGTVSHNVLSNSLVVPTSLLSLGMANFLILCFAVFGPTDKARRIFLWAYVLVVVFCACWAYWYTYS